MAKSIAFIGGLACLMVSVSSVWAEDTIQDFTALFPAADVAPRLTTTPNVAIIDGWDGKALRLTEELLGQNQGAAFNQAFGADWEDLLVSFEMRFTEGDGADGIGFALANSETFGSDNLSSVPTFTENVNLPGTFGVGFDIHNNLDIEGENSISIHWDGSQVVSTSLDDLNLFNLETGNPIEAIITVTPVDGGSNVSVILTDLDEQIVEPVYEDLFVANLLPYAGRPAFRGRTGGLTSEQSIDNLSVTYTPTGNGEFVTFTEDFESYPLGAVGDADQTPELVGGTPYTVANPGTDPGPTLINDGPAGGQQPGHLELSTEATGQHNFVAFDQTSNQWTNIRASFDFRISDLNGNHADGMGFVLVPTDIYGDSGNLTEEGGGWNPAEEPHLAGALGIGFDTFNNDFGIASEGCPTEGDTDLVCEEPGNGERRANHVSLHWDGSVNADHIDQVVLSLDEFDLANGEWNRVDLQVDETGDGMVVTLDITDGSDGSVHRLFDGFLIDGASFDGPVRAAFGARTGGSSNFHAIDNLSINFGDQDPCDFDGDGMLDVDDVNLLSEAIRAGTNEAAFDVNGDAIVDRSDLQFFVGDPSKLHTYIGDANLDGEFNSSDLVAVFISGEYEDDAIGNSTWGTGDWDGNGDFESSDLVFAFIDGGFEAGPRAAAAVPEPTSIAMALSAFCLLTYFPLLDFRGNE